jgi:diguanylate cyclase (GGDEF)-like protein
LPASKEAWLYAGQRTYGTENKDYKYFMSLRSRIVLLVLLATLTPAAMLGLYLVENRKAQITQAKQSLGALAAYAAENLGDKVSGTVQLLHGLRHSSDVDGANKEACSAFLNDVLKRYPQYTGLLTIRPDGQLHCDSLRTGRTLDLNDRAYFKQARTSTEPVFEAVFGRLTGVAVLQVAYPARDSAGELKYVLLASLNLAQFADRFATASPQSDMEVVIWDDKGTMIVRHPDPGPQKLAGTSQVESDLYRFARAAQTGETAQLPGPDGEVKIWALSVLPLATGAGLRIALGIPRDVLLAKADQDLYEALAILAAVSLLASLLALLFAEMGIRRHVARITAAAARQGTGDLSARIGGPYPRGELGGLMATLDATAASVQAQKGEIERKAEELRRINRTLRILSAINSTIIRVRNRDALLGEACRIAAEDGQFPIVWAGMLDRETMQVLPVAWQGVDQAFVESIPRSTAGSMGIVGLALRERNAVVVNDIASDTRMTMGKAALERGTRALAIFPLVVSGEAAGVLVLHAHEVGFFDEPEMKLLNELAGDVAFALEYIENSEKLDYLAYYDSLTGLANRALFNDRLSQFLSISAREGRMLALVVADIERFGTINETFGRTAGDELLKQIAGRASQQVPDIHWLARTGADHFSSIIPDEPELEGVARRIERLHRAVFGQPFQVGESELRVAARYGIALFPTDGMDADTLFRNAEAALKNVKKGGERYLFYDPQMTERVAEKLALENKLRMALENEEFVLHYQPKVDLQTRRIVGVEALIRWQSPELGLVPPMQFIPLLEETGLILQVGAWALKRAARDHREWGKTVSNPPRVAVNVSPIQLRHSDFVRDVRLAIREGVTPPGIDLELTESLVMEDIEGNIGKLKEARALGLSIAIDDFGTGHSSLAYLARLPVQSLKIDRSFIITMLSDPHTMTLVSTIISLAHSLRLTVVAEGVDAEEQAKVLHLLRCDQMQGFLFSRAVPKDELLSLLQRETSIPQPA